MVHPLLSRYFTDVYLLPLCKSRRVLELTAVQRLLDAAHNIR